MFQNPGNRRHAKQWRGLQLVNKGGEKKKAISHNFLFLLSGCINPLCNLISIGSIKCYMYGVLVNVFWIHIPKKKMMEKELWHPWAIVSYVTFVAKQYIQKQEKEALDSMHTTNM